MTALASRGIAAAKWSVVLTIARFAVQLVSQVVLARMLGPEVYGVFGMALVVFMLGAFLSEFGFGMYLLQRPQLSEQDLRFVFTWQVLIGLATAAAMVACAPWAAAYFQDDRVIVALHWLALASVINAVAALGKTLLSRDLNFRVLGWIEFGSYAVGFLGVGLVLALAGYGVEALVGATIGQALLRLLAQQWVRPHSWWPRFTHADAGGVFDIGRKVFFTNLVNWQLGNLDRVLIGRYLDAHAVGVYNIGFNLANTLGSLFVNALQPAFLSSGARVEGDRARLGRVYLEVLASIWIFITPAFVVLAFFGPEIIAILYGSRWVSAGPVLQALFLAMPAFLTWGLSTPILWNVGRGQLETLLQLPALVLGVPALVLAASGGVDAMAWTVVGVFVLRALATATAACRLVGLDARTVLPHLARGVVVSLLMALAAQAGVNLGTWLTGHWLGAFALGVLIPCAMLVAFAAARPAVFGDAAWSMAIRIVPRLSTMPHLAQLARTGDPSTGVRADGATG